MPERDAPPQSRPYRFRKHHLRRVLAAYAALKARRPRIIHCRECSIAPSYLRIAAVKNILMLGLKRTLGDLRIGRAIYVLIR